MAKKKPVHIYDITMSNGEVYKGVRLEGTFIQNYSGIANEFIPVQGEDGRKVDLVKYQVVKAELVEVESP